MRRRTFLSTSLSAVVARRLPALGDRSMKRFVLIGLAAALSGPAALAAQRAPDHHVPSRPETVTWGDYPLDRAPVLRMQSGQTVRIDAISHAGATQNDEP